jgi:4-hydroxymandelate oxidase
MEMNRRTLLAATGALLGSSLLERAGVENAPNDGTPPKSASDSAAETFNLFDFEGLARQRIPHPAYEYIAGGAADEITLRWNREAFDALALHPRVLVDIERIDTKVELFGRRLAFPVLLAPTAFHRLVHPDGEVETARGASAGEALFVVSSLSTRRVEDISRAMTQPWCFQLFDIGRRRREFLLGLLETLKANGCQGLVVTADAPVTGARNRSERAHFSLPEDFETPYYPDRTARKQVGGLPVSGSSTWADLAWLRSKTALPMMLKGVLHEEDAKLAVKAGMDGIIVSNHGGRELDTVPATITVLPRIIKVVGNRIPVLLDGGVRRGTDVLKALALGARAVLIGRPYLYGLSVGGAAGVAQVLGILRGEFEMAMKLSGCRTLAEINRAVIHGKVDGRPPSYV